MSHGGLRGLVSLLFLLAPLAALAQQASGPAYELGREDVAAVIVLGHPELSGDFTVDREGMLVYPILGRVKAAGLTAGDLEKKLTTLLADGYLKKPQVAVSVKEFRSQRIFVSGEVSKPGPHPLAGDRSLRELLSGIGFTADAGHEVLVVRPPRERVGTVEEGPVDIPGYVAGSEVYRLNRRALQAGRPEHDLLLVPGDSVAVPRASQIFVQGQVNRPGPQRFEEGMSLFEAFTAAGGVNERGSEKKIKVVRLVAGERVEVKADMSLRLEPGDTIVVGERLF